MKLQLDTEANSFARREERWKNILEGHKKQLKSERKALLAEKKQSQEQDQDLRNKDELLASLYARLEDAFMSKKVLIRTVDDELRRLRYELASPGYPQHGKVALEGGMENTQCKCAIM